MQRLLPCLAVIGIAFTLSLPLTSRAAEVNNYDALAAEAESAAPVIPHQVGMDENGEACLACHKGGAHGAPITPHAMRLYCTQCHVPKVAAVQKPAAAKKSTKK